jgi:hypothetical protein
MVDPPQDVTFTIRLRGYDPYVVDALVERAKAGEDVRREVLTLDPVLRGYCRKEVRRYFDLPTK